MASSDSVSQQEATRPARAWFARRADELAPALLGMRLVRLLDDGRQLAGEIVETEAYLGPVDRACHTFGGRRTARNEVMWGEPGRAYVYFTYGMHHCVNVVCGDCSGEAVLVRALAPIAGLELMGEHRRSRPDGRPARRSADTVPHRELCSGPARLCRALLIDLGLNGEDLVRSSRLFLEGPGRGRGLPGVAVNTTRIGIQRAGEWAAKPLRWYRAESPHVSVR